MPKAAALFALVLLSFCASRPQDAPPVVEVHVAAGPYDRVNTVTSFTLPAGMAGAAYRLVDASGQATAVQQDGAGNAWFILDNLPAEETRVYRLEQASPAALPAAVAVERDGGAVRFSVEGRPVLTYQAEETEPPDGVDPAFRRGGYIHPVHTPAGRLVTDDYPPNHIHHHGIWAAWTSTEFQGRTPDFWNMGERTGTVEPVALDVAWGGPVHGGLQARHRYVDLTAPEPVTALDEQWEVYVYGVRGNGRDYWLFDLVSTQTATDGPLRLPEYRYGGVGFRGHRQWDGAEHTFFLTSEGKDRSDGHATHARWCHIGGYVDGELAGLAVLDHPANFRAPQPMRIHPTEPFFNYAPSQAGDWAIEPGQPYVARYRFVVYDGPPDADLLNRLWNDYASPPEVLVTTR